ncbi:spermidine synthase [Pacificimonas sp. WHA3]|uniref:Spermidine synthase n=1 Tax=Pacificimonas pallii TaxID=2827236 RepID=A0ABS6SBU7_9SPHN|nr:spermidine synthase [Pacificimonas pallii]MBV7255801.1 spermidine synthase [Pacificimonas pallii]
MLERIIIDETELLSGGTLRLVQRGEEFVIMLYRAREGWTELMSSRRGGSEAALATEALKGTAADAHVLIGGLGMGVTLRQALSLVGKKARVVVAELVPEVVQWAKGPMKGVFDGALDDPRVRIVIDDVALVLEDVPEGGASGGARGYDAILLDVDNGPDGLTQAANSGLYSTRGLSRAKKALAPGGVLAIWSANDDPRFTRRLQQVGFAVETSVHRSGARGRGARHIIWLARRAS